MFRKFGFCIIMLVLGVCVGGEAQESLPADLERYGSLEIRLENPGDFKKLLRYRGIYADHSASRISRDLIVNEAGYKILLEKEIEFKIRPVLCRGLRIKSRDELTLNKNNSDCMPAMDFYPSYEAYETLMFSFEERFPELCEILDIGTLSSGRRILMAHISSPVVVDNPKPNFLYTSTMHGDEITGYVLMLQLIDHLLCNYERDDRVRNIVDGINIFINPLANPDGTYRGGNHTVESSSRFNRNFYDLNRNFPDAKVGENPNGPYQEETLIFMDFAENYQIHMSANLHGGVELVNYPWDTFQERHADDEWMEKVSRNYADTVQHFGHPGYFTDLDNGITNGFDWYEVQGSRQDYHCYFKTGRELTIELSDTKRLTADSLPVYWSYNKNALVNYLEHSQKALLGYVTDCQTGEAVDAEIFIPGHDYLNSEVRSDAESGAYFRYLAEGDYEIRFSASGYDTVFSSISVIDLSTMRLDVELCPDNMVSTGELYSLDFDISVIGDQIRLISEQPLRKAKASIYSLEGQHIYTIESPARLINLPARMATGMYILHIKGDEGKSGSRSFFYSR